MPELPEVQTTVNGLNDVLPGLKIVSVWSDYDSLHYKGKENIKDRKYFSKFKKEILGAKVLKAERRGKNILIHLNNERTILIHMKLTGHLLYGKYEKRKEWVAKDKGPLQDPFNKYIRLVFELSNKKHLALSDMRKFAKIMYLKTKEIEEHGDIKKIGPDVLKISFKKFKELLLKKNGLIKNVLMDQSLISGIGNICSDEILWHVGLHPETKIKDIDDKKLQETLKKSKELLRKGVKLRGDSTSDYRDVKGEKGKFQAYHRAYQQTGEECQKRSCSGKIQRKTLGGRSAHFCNKHQALKKGGK
jgi:formamidopyrimidine-DNA glycosylase